MSALCLNTEPDKASPHPSDDPEWLAKCCLESLDGDTRRACLARLADADLLALVARQSLDIGLRLAASAKARSLAAPVALHRLSSQDQFVFDLMYTGQGAIKFDLAEVRRASVQRYLDLAQKAFQRDEPNMALAHLLIARSAFGECEALWNRLGVVLGDMDRHEEALFIIDTGLNLDPMSTRLWNNKGRTLRNMGQNAAGLLCYEYAALLGKHEPTPLLNKARTLVALGRPARAKLSVEAMLKLDPADPQGRALLAYLQGSGKSAFQEELSDL